MIRDIVQMRVCWQQVLPGLMMQLQLPKQMHGVSVSRSMTYAANTDAVTARHEATISQATKPATAVTQQSLHFCSIAHDLPWSARHAANDML